MDTDRDFYGAKLIQLEDSLLQGGVKRIPWCLPSQPRPKKMFNQSWSNLAHFPLLQHHLDRSMLPYLRHLGRFRMLDQDL